MADNKYRERQEDLISHLEDGSYLQGRSALKCDLGDGKVGHCCMGVATDLWHRATGRGKWVATDDYGVYEFVLNDCAYSTLPPPEVVDYFGFRDANGRFSAAGTPWERVAIVTTGRAVAEYYSTTVNDKGGTFAEIAKIWRNAKTRVFRR